MAIEKLDLKSLHEVIASLAEVLEIVRNDRAFAERPAAYRRMVMAATIQNFEFVHELSAKMIRRQLELLRLDPEEDRFENYRDMLRVAGEKGLIDDVEAWFAFRALRNATSHTYNQQRAEEVFAGIPAFFNAAEHLLRQLELHNA